MSENVRLNFPVTPVKKCPHDIPYYVDKQSPWDRCPECLKEHMRCMFYKEIHELKEENKKLKNMVTKLENEIQEHDWDTGIH